MRALLVAAAVAGLAIGATPATAQNFNDIGRELRDQVLGARPNPDREREAYERGREDQARRHANQREDWRREQEARRYDDRRREDRYYRDRDWDRSGR